MFILIIQNTMQHSPYVPTIDSIKNNKLNVVI